ncbi:ATP-binding protein [Paraflavitalea sp. CAU 1676]|uniref:sensor histidine kinase n=1 Tax=Paraflavitalea sp. CAU 1676 TaxID=3032598 RepID=UPI0023DB8FE7|nr:ATP-binding protein [Paraflavitalea sp. CAU 1676]MDF2192279.1 ATP-binding protein [Paraflavitalea sp. CAU 1676]
MKGISIVRRIRDVSIKKKLYFTVGIMALLIAIELCALFFSINTLSSVRAYVNGEGLWSKAQKDAMYQLLKYGRTRNDSDYVQFQEFMKVPLGDHRALVEMQKPEPDNEITREGLIAGRNHPDDVDGMITLFRRFHKNRYINKAIGAWTAADSLVPGFIVIGDQLHQEINSVNPSDERIQAILAEIDPLNRKITPFEDKFSYTMGEGSRWLENLVLKILFFIALTVELTGLGLAFWVSRNIQKGLDEILRSAQAVTQGDLSSRAQSFSNDEIGKLANDFNKMTAELERMTEVIQETNVTLERKVQHRTAELERKNKELEQFAYVASHDLQEPLRTTTGFVEALRKQYKGRLDDHADKYLDYIAQSAERMKTLIKDLLDYSRIGREKLFVPVHCNNLLAEVKADLDTVIQESKAVITVGELPVVHALPTELKLLFQNLISNSIKFRRAGVAPVIHIDVQADKASWKFSVKDNGIGMDPGYQDRIFIIFQRLHTRQDYEGSGIGLAHCKKIVELHGGSIWVDSVPGQGSTFYFTIAEMPLQSEDLKPQPSRQPVSL